MSIAAGEEEAEATDKKWLGGARGNPQSSLVATVRDPTSLSKKKGLPAVEHLLRRRRRSGILEQELHHHILPARSRG